MHDSVWICTTLPKIEVEVRKIAHKGRRNVRISNYTSVWCCDHQAKIQIFVFQKIYTNEIRNYLVSYKKSLSEQVRYFTELPNYHFIFQ